LFPKTMIIAALNLSLSLFESLAYLLFMNRPVSSTSEAEYS